MRWFARAALIVACGVGWACSGDRTGRDETGSIGLGRAGVQSSGSGSQSGSSGTNQNAAAGSGFGNAPPNGSGGSSAGAPPHDAGAAQGCVGTSKTAPPAAQPKADIVWVVDASGSMLDEQKKIGTNLTTFADGITAANLDVHIVMLTTGASIPIICPEMSPDPLAGTKLAGDPRYMFIDSKVDSHNLLDVVVASYPQYSMFLRSDAVTHVVTVSDDESTYKGLGTPAERASTFKTDMEALLGHGFIQHTISSEGPTACGDPNCMPDENSGLCVVLMLGCGAAAPGDTYYMLATQTMGLSASICQSDWSAIFDPLTKAVIASAPLPCNYAIPAPPTGQSLDPGLVNVAWRAPGAMKDQVFPKAAGASACGDKLAWYYDVDYKPTQVNLCPATCAQVSKGGTLNIAFGCATAVVQ